ncbi:hypothetical protein QUD30_19110, partial [Staphylococcus aureus]
PAIPIANSTTTVMTLINIIFFMKHFLLFAFKIHFIYYRDMITKKTPTIFIRVLVKIHKGVTI